MGEGIFNKFKNWITEEEEDFDGVEEEYEQEDEEEVEQFTSIPNTKTAKIVNLHTASPMKVVIVEPKKYEEVTTIADHLKQKKAVIVNLENLNDPGIRKSIFEFMNGAVYVLDGGIFILAPNNVDIDSSIKKELESKTLFPWQSK